MGACFGTVTARLMFDWWFSAIYVAMACAAVGFLVAGLIHRQTVVVVVAALFVALGATYPIVIGLGARSITVSNTTLSMPTIKGRPDRPGAGDGSVTSAHLRERQRLAAVRVDWRRCGLSDRGTLRYKGLFGLA